MREDKDLIITSHRKTDKTRKFSPAEGFVICCLPKKTPILGSRKAANSSYPNSFDKKATPLEYYPLSAKELVEELNLNYICFPDGNLTSGTQEYSLRHVSITSHTAIKRYATCLNILDGKYTGLALCLLSRLPLYDLFDKWIIECYYCLVGHICRKIRSPRYSMEFILEIIK